MRQLLSLTDIPIPEIAAASGFKYVEHMIPIPRNYHGCTPAV